MWRVRSDRYNQVKDRSMESISMEPIPVDLYGKRVFPGKGVDLKDVETDIRDFYDLKGDAGFKGE